MTVALNTSQISTGSTCSNDDVARPEKTSTQEDQMTSSCNKNTQVQNLDARKSVEQELTPEVLRGFRAMACALTAPQAEHPDVRAACEWLAADSASVGDQVVLDSPPSLSPEQGTALSRYFLTDTRRQILELAQFEGAISASDVALNILRGRNQRAATTALKVLHALGLLTPIRTCEYKLSDAGQARLDSIKEHDRGAR